MHFDVRPMLLSGLVALLRPKEEVQQHHITEGDTLLCDVCCFCSKWIFLLKTDVATQLMTGNGVYFHTVLSRCILYVKTSTSINVLAFYQWDLTHLTWVMSCKIPPEVERIKMTGSLPVFVQQAAAAKTIRYVSKYSIYTLNTESILPRHFILPVNYFNVFNCL